MDDKFLTPEEYNLGDLFCGKYSIPIYQRPYSWEKSEVSQLINDMLVSYENRNVESNAERLLFAGTIFIKFENNIKNKYNEYTIVDGQQRITTMTLLLMVILNYLYKTESEDEIVTEIENYLWKKTDRKRDKSLRVLKLGNIDEEILVQLFDELYSKKDIIAYAKNLINDKFSNNLNDIEENLLNNLIIINDILLPFEDEDYYEFFDHIKDNVRIITIEVYTNLIKVFSIFESINSKGKPLDEIDLIKTYIFQSITEQDYDEYLRKWGQLIEETNDNLMDYLIIYIRANINYYRNSLKLNNFKTLCSNQLKKYYKKDLLSETIKALIDDLLANVKYYKLITNQNELENSHISIRSKCLFMMNIISEYKHTRALYMKLLILYFNNNLSKEVFERLVENAFRFIITFQSVCSRESKRTIAVFEDVQNIIYKLTYYYKDDSDFKEVDFKEIDKIFNKILVENSITEESIRNNIKGALTYNKNKRIVKVILSYLEYYKSESGVDYTKLYNLLRVGKYIHIDHILPQTPDKDDEDYKYYILGESVVLKEGQDFIFDPSSSVMNKDEFFEEYLDVLGNLRLMWSSDNIKKSNGLVDIKEFDSTFNTSTQISKRTTTLSKQIIESGILMFAKPNSGLIDDEEDEKYIISVKYDKNISYQNYKPISFELLGEKYIIDNGKFSKLLLKILEILFDLEPNAFIRLAKEKYRPMNSDRVYISSYKKDIRKALVLDDDIYVEYNLSSDYIVKFLYLILSEVGLSESDLKLFFEKK